MLIAFLCVFVASLLPLLWIAFAKINAGFRGKHNYNPREFMEASKGRAKRALWAEKNALEAFPPFAAAVFVAVFCQVDSLSLSVLSLLFIFSRVLHGIFYIIDQPKRRSLVWFVGVGCTAGLFLLSLFSFDA